MAESTHGTPRRSDSDDARFEAQSTVAERTKAAVIEAIRDLDDPTPTRILNHPNVGWRAEQVRRARRELEADGRIDWEPHPADARKRVYRVVD